MDKNGSTQAIIELLQGGVIEMTGLVPWGSNYTFLVQVCGDQEEVDAIYKPNLGERPLWDFEQGTLSKRERAAFLVSEVLSWDLVPPTVIRDGPHGEGSLQYFVQHDTEQHYLTLGDSYKDQISRIALFDALINNADRKSGHVLLGLDKRLWAIDHGVSFHSEYKLRSVIWEFAGDPIPEPLWKDLTGFRTWLSTAEDGYRHELQQLLSRSEIAALGHRLELMLRDGCFPLPGSGRHYPWPII
jgi:uncharacterized repeat protein (TIGR03843 family)